MEKKYIKTFLIILALVIVVTLAAVLIIANLSYLANTSDLPSSTTKNESEEPNAAITSIDIKNKNIKMEPGNVQKLEFSVYPIGTDIEELSITSSNDDIVRIVNGSIEAIADGEAIISISAKNGISASCNIYVETPYKLKDERNIGFYELNNGEVLEYCCEYNDYALKVHNMTSYQRENRTFEKDGLYVHVKGPVYKVDEAGAVYIDLGPAEDNIFSPALFADITLESSQSNLLMQLNIGDSIEVYAKLDEYSYNAAVTTVSFELYGGIIVMINSTETEIPKNFVPQIEPEYPDSNPPTETDSFPCVGSYSKGDDTITISKTEEGVLYISIADSQGIIAQGTAYYSIDDPYSGVVLYTDYGNIEILPYKANYSIMVSVDGKDAGTYFSN